MTDPCALQQAAGRALYYDGRPDRAALLYALAATYATTPAGRAVLLDQAEQAAALPYPVPARVLRFNHRSSNEDAL